MPPPPPSGLRVSDRRGELLFAILFFFSASLSFPKTGVYYRCSEFFSFFSGFVASTFAASSDILLLIGLFLVCLCFLLFIYNYSIVSLSLFFFIFNYVYLTVIALLGVLHVLQNWHATNSDSGFFTFLCAWGS